MERKNAVAVVKYLFAYLFFPFPVACKMELSRTDSCNFPWANKKGSHLHEEEEEDFLNGKVDGNLLRALVSPPGFYCQL